MNKKLKVSIIASIKTFFILACAVASAIVFEDHGAPGWSVILILVSGLFYAITISSDLVKEVKKDE